MTGILQVKKGRPNYYIVLDYVDEATGNRKRKWVTTDIPIAGNNKRRANEKLKEVLAEYEEQKIDFNKDTMFTDYISDWLESLKYDIASTTYDAYKLTLNVHIIPYFKPKKLKVKEISPVHIQQYKIFKLNSLSGNTIRKHLSNISKCLDSAVKQNIIAFNPVKRIDLPKKVKYTGAKFYNEKQIELLLESSRGDPLEIVILLTVFYGLRKSEVLGLKWDAVDMVNNTITIKHTVVAGNKVIHKKDSTKNDSSYAILPMPGIIKSELKTWKAKQAQHKLLQPNDYISEGYVCTQIDGSLMRPDYVNKHFKLLLKKKKLNIIRFHDLRHSAASYLKYLGFDLKDIQVWLRHKDIQTTMNIYTHLDMEAKKNIANSLNERFINFG